MADPAPGRDRTARAVPERTAAGDPQPLRAEHRASGERPAPGKRRQGRTTGAAHPERRSAAEGRTSRPSDPLALEQARRLPRLRYMGSKHRLLPWLHRIFTQLEFSSALDAFAGSCAVAYLLKSMGKRVVANDFLDFPRWIGRATVENSAARLTDDLVALLCHRRPGRRDFISRTFRGIFFTPEDLAFLDTVWSNLPALPGEHHRAVALAALVRACVKRQPRGVFTVAGDPERYKDGRRDLRLGLAEHFREGVAAYGEAVFDNGRENAARRSDVFELEAGEADLVYLDPPYVPRADDNCYVKRYHFLEGLVSYWQEPGTEVQPASKVRKIPKRYTPFSYRRTAPEAFDALFRRFAESTLVLSYSSNGFPDLGELVRTMRRYKREVEVFERPHRYSFGTHGGVAEGRAVVREYVVVGL